MLSLFQFQIRQFLGAERQSLSTAFIFAISLTALPATAQQLNLSLGQEQAEEPVTNPFPNYDGPYCVNNRFANCNEKQITDRKLLSRVTTADDLRFFLRTERGQALAPQLADRTFHFLREENRPHLSDPVHRYEYNDNGLLTREVRKLLVYSGRASQFQPITTYWHEYTYNKNGSLTRKISRASGKDEWHKYLSRHFFYHGQNTNKPGYAYQLSHFIDTRFQITQDVFGGPHQENSKSMFMWREYESGKPTRGLAAFIPELQGPKLIDGRHIVEDSAGNELLETDTLEEKTREAAYSRNFFSGANTDVNEILNRMVLYRQNTYDNQGRLVKSQKTPDKKWWGNDAMGEPEIKTCRYDLFGFAKICWKKSGPLGYQNIEGYDKFGHLLITVRGSEGWQRYMRYSYNSSGRIASIEHGDHQTGKLDKTTKFTYNRRGLLTDKSVRNAEKSARHYDEDWVFKYDERNVADMAVFAHNARYSFRDE